MTEKRFTTNNGVFYKDNKTGWEFKCYEEVVRIMNELAEENEYFKQYFRNNGIKEIVVGDCKIVLSDETSNGGG